MLLPGFGLNTPRNKKMIRLLAVNNLKANRFRFTLSVIAIALTALLITGVFTMSLSLYETDKLQQFYRYGWRFHGVIQNLRAEERDTLLASGAFTEYGYFSSLTRYPSGLPLEMVYGSDNIPALTLTKLTGHMPKRADEIALSTTELDRFGVPHRLGETITLTYTVADREKTAAFTVCGFWRENPDGSVMKARVFVSEAFAKAENFTDDIFLFVNFDRPEQIQSRLTAIMEKLGIEASYGANPLYEAESNAETQINRILVDTLPPFAALLLLIILCAYMLIYNIFYISVTRDIRFYGLLRAVGATKGQLRRMIRLQAVLLSGVGIPAGLLLGYLISLVIVPAFLTMGNYEVYAVSAHPLIFVFAAVFALMTVLLSASRPGALAGRVSPVEAVRHVEAHAPLKRKELKSTYGAKPVILAARNLSREKKKRMLSVASLSVGIGLFCISGTLITSFSLDMYLKVRMYGDIRISNPKMNVAAQEDIGDILSPAIGDELRAVAGVTAVETVYYWETIDPARESEEIDRIYVDGQRQEVTKFMTAEVYGLSDGWAHALVPFIAEGDWNPALFASGEYAVISKTIKTSYHADGSYAGAEDVWLYQPGDKIRLAGMDRALTVMAVLNDTSFPLLGKQRIIANRYELYLPVDTVSALEGTALNSSLLGGALPMSYTVFTESDALASVERTLRALVSDRVGIEVASAKTYISEFNNQVGAMTTIALGLSLLLCLVGILNFINTSAISVIARRYELSVLEAMGMTKAQLKRMLTLECLYTGGLSLAIAWALSYPLSERIVGQLVRVNGFITFTYAWRALLIGVIGMGLAGVITALASYRSIAQASVSARLKQAESRG